MSAIAPAQFNFQFFQPAVLGVAQVAAGCKLHTYLTGTTTNHATYTDAAGVVPNANPITLDADGQCTIFLDPTVAYKFVLKDAADSATLHTWNDIVAAAPATSAVVSVNGLTGVVALDASGIPYETSSSATWLTADNVESALDQIADRANAPPADSVTLAPVSGLTATDVQAGIAELAAKAVGTQLLRITPFLTSGTWTKGDDVGAILVKCVGGGGGGGGGAGSGDAGGGGGGAGYSEKLITAPGATETVTIGTGGASLAAGVATTFGAWVSAGGGGAGGARNGGAGGVGTGGDINLRGGPGGWGGSNDESAFGGSGGDSHLGGGAAATTAHAGTGVTGTANTGGGGSGGVTSGGIGGTGACYVYEYSV